MTDALITLVFGSPIWLLSFWAGRLYLRQQWRSNWPYSRRVAELRERGVI